MGLCTQAGLPLTGADWIIVAVAFAAAGWWFWMTTRRT